MPAARRHGVLVGNRGGDHGAERHEDDRHQQREAALAAGARQARVVAAHAAAHAATSMMRTILPQSAVSMVISTASGRWRIACSLLQARQLVGGGHCICQL